MRWKLYPIEIVPLSIVIPNGTNASKFRYDNQAMFKIRRGSIGCCVPLSDWRFPSGKRARVCNASTFKESSPISLPVCVKRLKDVALNKLRVRATGATRGAVEERVANNFRTVVYLRSFSTSEKETAQHRTSIFLLLLFLSPLCFEFSQCNLWGVAK